MRYFVYLLPMLFFGFLSHAQQTPTVIWQTSFGGSGSDLIYSMCATPDGMIYVNGTTYSNDYDVRGLKGVSGMWCSRLDTTGYLYLTKCYGSTGYANGAHMAPINGGFLLVGSNSGSGGDVSVPKGQLDIWTTIIDDQGALIKDKSYGGTGYDRATSGVRDVDGGYVLLGTSYSKDGDVDTSKQKGGGGAWVVKLDTGGNVVWQNFLYDTADRPLFAEGIQQVADSSYIVVGSTLSDVVVVKLDRQGAQQWMVTYGGDSTKESLYDVCDAGDGGYVAVGYSKSANGDLDTNYGEEDVWVIKLNDTGGTVWQQNYGGSKQDVGRSIIQCLEGGFLFLGYTCSADVDVNGNHSSLGSSDIWAVKIDDTGKVVWQKCMGGDNFEYGRKVIQMSSGNFLIGGYAESWTGDLNVNHGDYDAWLLKLSNPYVVSVAGVLNDNDVMIYPNPANDKVIVTLGRAIRGDLELIDMQGRVLLTQPLNEQVKRYSLNVQSLPAGNYHIRLATGGKILTKQITVVH